MKTETLAARFEKAASESSWLRLLLIFLVSPLFWFLLGLGIGEQVFFGWLIITFAYVTALLVGANSYTLEKKKLNRKFEVSRALVALLSPFFWGGILIVPYMFFYLYVFDQENFLAR